MPVLSPQHQRLYGHVNVWSCRFRMAYMSVAVTMRRCRAPRAGRVLQLRMCPCCWHKQCVRTRLTIFAVSFAVLSAQQQHINMLLP